jgi:hypothetical protein
MKPLDLELIKHTPQGSGTTKYFLNAVTNFSLSIYTEDGFSGPEEDPTTDELVLTLFVNVNTDPPRVKAHHPIVHLVPLGETNPTEGGTVLVVKVIDQYDVEYIAERFGGGSISSQIEPDETARPFSGMNPNVVKSPC